MASSTKKKRRSWQLTSNTTLWKTCKKNLDSIVNGKLLCLDPSCGSASSMPGYAIYENGQLKGSGTIHVEGVHRELPYRLQDIARSLREDFETPDVLVIEEIPVRRYGGGGATGHASLLKSMGLMMGTVEAPLVIRIRPQAWRALKHDDWWKDDEQDAIAMGHAVLQVCKKILEEK